VKVSYFGVRGAMPAPGPGTVRYGGNTACTLVRLHDGGLIVLDCGTGARSLGLALQAAELGNGSGAATFLLSHSHWDHVQGFPFFRPFYAAGNRFTIYGGATSPDRLEALLEGQMAAEYFPLQSFRNMGAHIDVRAVPPERSFVVGSAAVRVQVGAQAGQSVFAYRIEDAGRVLVYVAHAGYGPGGPDAETLALYRDADLLIHEATFLPEADHAVDAALGAHARRLALFHYSADYTDHQVDELVARARLRGRDDPSLEITGAAEGTSVDI
jgi:phosphoribosyl 1,2-cyclic phosphodiesterase